MMSTHLTLEALQDELAAAGQSPQDCGTVEMIVRRPAVGEREVLEHAEVDLTEGLVGDTWQARGSSSTEDGRAHPEAQGGDDGGKEHIP